MRMQTYQRIWLNRRSGKMSEKKRVHWRSPVVRHITLVAVTVLGLVLIGGGLGTRAIGAFALSLLIRFNELSGVPESSDGSGDYRNRSTFRDDIANVHSGFVPGLPLPFPESNAG